MEKEARERRRECAKHQADERARILALTRQLADYRFGCPNPSISLIFLIVKLNNCVDVIGVRSAAAVCTPPECTPRPAPPNEFVATTPSSEVNLRPTQARLNRMARQEALVQQQQHVCETRVRRPGRPKSQLDTTTATLSPPPPPLPNRPSKKRKLVLESQQQQQQQQLCQ